MPTNWKDGLALAVELVPNTVMALRRRSVMARSENHRQNLNQSITALLGLHAYLHVGGLDNWAERHGHHLPRRDQILAEQMDKTARLTMRRVELTTWPISVRLNSARQMLRLSNAQNCSVEFGFDTDWQFEVMLERAWRMFQNLRPFDSPQLHTWTGDEWASCAQTSIITESLFQDAGEMNKKFNAALGPIRLHEFLDFLPNFLDDEPERVAKLTLVPKRFSISEGILELALLGRPMNAARLRRLCADGRVPGAQKINGGWTVTEDGLRALVDDVRAPGRPPGSRG
ncbi:MAG: hypothetical protein AB7E32_16930 [Desulfovibrio sp.]